jgi:glutathione synthase/RimK-type ligase-like ATP-grasp enzyme
MSVLIVSSGKDIHARAVAWGLNSVGIGADIIDIFHFPSNGCLSIKPVNGGNTEFFSANRQNKLIALSPIKVIWCRRLLFSPLYLDYSKVHVEDLNNVVPEIQAFIANLWTELEDELPVDTIWVNGIGAATNAKNKAKQLKIAALAGLKVPNTIISNSPIDIRAFCEMHGGEIVMKPFSQKRWIENGLQYQQPTYLINERHLTNDLAIQLCPGIFQNYVEKQFELRVVVFGEKILAVKLASQDHSHSKIDWRMDVYKQVMKIEPFQLDKVIEGKIFIFMKKMNLRFGSIDLIVTPENEIIFLEINEQGQFLFLESQCPSLNVLGEMCKFLAREAGVNKEVNWPTFTDFLTSSEGLSFLAEQNLPERDPKFEIKYSFN